MYRRRPPFGREAAAELDGERPVLGGVLLVAAGVRAWARARTWRALDPAPPAVCVPPGEAAQAFDWSCARGREVWLYADDVDGEGAATIARCLLFAGAQRVEAVARDVESVVYTPERNAA